MATKKEIEDFLAQVADRVDCLGCYQILTSRDPFGYGNARAYIDMDGNGKAIQGLPIPGGCDPTESGRFDHLPINYCPVCGKRIAEVAEKAGL